jgi:hypothetical protein
MSAVVVPAYRAIPTTTAMAAPTPVPSFTAMPTPTLVPIFAATPTLAVIMFRLGRTGDSDYASAVAAMMSSFGPMVLGLIGDGPCRL